MACPYIVTVLFIIHNKTAEHAKQSPLYLSQHKHAKTRCFLCSSVSVVYVKIYFDSSAILDAEASCFGLQYKHGVAYTGTIFTLNSIILPPLSLSLSLCLHIKYADGQIRTAL